MMRNKESGMVTAEFAMIMPLVLAVLGLVASLGSAMITHLNVADAAREAARTIAMDVPESEVRALVDAKAPGSDMALSRHGQKVSVTVSKDIGGVLSPLNLVASSTITTIGEPR